MRCHLSCTVGLIGLMLVGTAAAQYQATVLPTGSFGPDLFAFDGVGTGNITGNGSFNPANPAQRHALFWGSPAGSPVDLHPSGSYTQSYATAASGNRQAGYALFASGFDAYVWSGTAASAVKINKPGNNYSLAYGMSGSQVVGYAVDDGTAWYARAALWTGNGAAWSYTNLHPAGSEVWKSLAEGTDGVTQVGWLESGANYARHAVRWKGTAASAVDLHPGGGYSESEANGVFGAITGGNALFPGGVHAMVWVEGAGGLDVHPSGWTGSVIDAVGDGIQVGTASGSAGTHAMLWRGSAASAFDLHTLLPKDEFASSAALGVDPLSNTIYGWGDLKNGEARAIVWTIVPEPTSLLWLCGAMLALRRRTGASITHGKPMTRPARSRPDAVSVEPLEPRRLLTTYYVAPTGLDTNAGTSLALPFKTIQKAAGLAVAGDTVLIREGTYRETVRPSNSGTSSQRIVFKPYNNETVTISGADLVTGWTQHDGATYRASMSWSTSDLNTGNYRFDDMQQVFVNGRMMNWARFPNTSLDPLRPTFLRADSASETYAFTDSRGRVYYHASYADSELTQPTGYWDGAQVHFRGGEGWQYQTAIVTSYTHDGTRGTVSFTYRPNWDGSINVSVGDPFWLEGKLAALDSGGEWYRDGAAGLLYLRTPESSNPSSSLVEAKRRADGFDLRGRDYITIEGLRFFAARVNTDASSDYNRVTGIQSAYGFHSWDYDNLLGTYDYNALETNSRAHLFDGGSVVLWGVGNELRDSVIGLSSGPGVRVAGTNVVVENNVVHNCGYSGWLGGNIRMHNSYNALVSRNTVYNSAGITLEVTNGYKARVLHNDVFRGAMMTLDNGLIYTSTSAYSGTVPNSDYTEIAYNTVHDNDGEYRYGARGIYIDNAASNYIVHHNVVWGVRYGIHLNRYSTQPSQNNFIYNNTSYGLQTSLAVGSSGATGPSAVRNNILPRGFQVTADDLPNFTISTNLFAGRDARVVDPLVYDFALLAESPAIDAGTALSPYTDGFAGSAPDIGALEHGVASWTAGSALVNPSDPSTTPGAFAGLVAAVITPGSVSMSWPDRFNNELAYVVERAPDAFNYVTLATLPSGATSYADTGLSEGLRYYYRVRALLPDDRDSYAHLGVRTPRSSGDAIEGEWYDGTSGTFLESEALVPVGAVGGYDSGDWTRYSGIDLGNGVESFTVRVARPSTISGIKLELRLDSPTGALLGSLTPQGTGDWYTFATQSAAADSSLRGIRDVYVVGVNPASGGCFNLDFLKLNRLPLTAPASATDVQATTLGTTLVRLDWGDASDNESGFRIERREPGGAFAEIARVSAGITRFDDATALPERQYEYRVVAYNTAGESPPSNVATAATTAPRVSGVAWNDANGNGTREPGEVALPGRTIHLDANGNGSLDVSADRVVAATGLPKSIPDNATTSSSVTVADLSMPLRSVAVQAYLTHTRMSDIVLTLIHPDGTRVTLLNRRGGSGDNLGNSSTDVVFNDTAASAITAGSPPWTSPTNTWRPEQPLSAFAGKSGNGAWTLEVRDAASSQTGTLRRWSLRVVTDGEPFATTDADGRYSFTFDTPGSVTLRQLLPVDWYATVPSSSHVAEVSFGVEVIRDFGSRQFVPGDVNGDGVVNNQDIAAFVLALTNPSGFAERYPSVPLLATGDLNHDGVVNNQDIAPFVALLTGGRPAAAATPDGVSRPPVRRPPSSAPSSDRLIDLVLRPKED